MIIIGINLCNNNFNYFECDDDDEKNLATTIIIIIVIIMKHWYHYCTIEVMDNYSAHIEEMVEINWSFILINFILIMTTTSLYWWSLPWW